MDELISEALSNPPLVTRELSPADGAVSHRGAATSGVSARCARIRAAVHVEAESRGEAALAHLRCSQHPYVAPVLAGFHGEDGPSQARH